MSVRLRLFIIICGGIIVLATFTFPLWRPEPAASSSGPNFPELTDEEQSFFAALPEDVQDVYIQMRSDNAQMAVDLLRARLNPAEPLPEDEQTPPPIENAILAADGEFALIELEDDDEREYQPYNVLYAETSGMVMIYVYPDNRKLLRIEDLNVINGHNLRVLLSSNPAPLISEDITNDRTRLDIGALRATSGSLNYTNVPVEIDIRNYQSVVLYDQTYDVIFGVAQIN